MLRTIRVRNYKSLVDVDVDLDSLAVIFGPNAAGKSNFLDALQLLSRLATSRTLKDAFEPPYRGTPLESYTFGPEGIRGLLEQKSASFSIEVDVELSAGLMEGVNQQIREMKRGKSTDESDGSRAESSDSTSSMDAERADSDEAENASAEPSKLSFVREKNLRYRIEVEISPKSGILRVADEYLSALTAKGRPTGKRSPFLERVKNRLHLRMEGQAHPTYYERYLDHSILSLPLYPPHYPHLVAIRQELASWFFFYFEPRERMRAVNPVKEVRHIGLMGEELAAFLNTLRALHPDRFRAVEQALRMVIPSITGIDVGVSSLGEVELRLLEGSIPIPARVLSEGTLRVLGLLALGAAKESQALIGFEEPENGVHRGRIRMIAEFLKTRAASGETQIIVTTHSPILPDLIPDEFLYVCRKLEGRTSIEPFNNWGPLFRKTSIDGALDDHLETLPVSERILRGDFDA